MTEKKKKISQTSQLFKKKSLIKSEAESIEQKGKIKKWKNLKLFSHLTYCVLSQREFIVKENSYKYFLGKQEDVCKTYS